MKKVERTRPPTQAILPSEHAKINALAWTISITMKQQRRHQQQQLTLKVQAPSVEEFDKLEGEEKVRILTEGKLWYMDFILTFDRCIHGEEGEEHCSRQKMFYAIVPKCTKARQFLPNIFSMLSKEEVGHLIVISTCVHRVDNAKLPQFWRRECSFQH
jgi:hypothetical protein